MKLIDNLLSGKLVGPEAEKVLIAHATDDSFQQELSARMKVSRQQSELTIARHGEYATAKLIQLTESENHGIARRACLDIIDLLKGQIPEADLKTEPEPQALPPELARKLLAFLAGELRQSPQISQSEPGEKPVSP